jgi:hypothetical protein
VILPRLVFRGITNPKYKLLRFLTTNFLQREEGASFKLASSALFTANSLPLLPYRKMLVFVTVSHFHPRLI